MLASVGKSWVDRFIEWGLTREQESWELGTARGYRRELERLERLTGKRPELLRADEPADVPSAARR
jgi:hypothetical protein